jgi:hypothetical protein
MEYEVKSFKGNGVLEPTPHPPLSRDRLSQKGISFFNFLNSFNIFNFYLFTFVFLIFLPFTPSPTLPFSFSPLLNPVPGK